jgi:hypothetical protein
VFSGRFFCMFLICILTLAYYNLLFFDVFKTYKDELKLDGILLYSSALEAHELPEQDGHGE